MKKDIDELLKQALAPTDEPNFWLNKRILNQVKEEDRMNIRKAGRIPAAAIAAAIVIGAGSVSAYAAWRYLSPNTITQKIKDGKLTKAFESKDAVELNETQVCGDYKITLLGMVSGKDITDYEMRSNGQICEDRSYIAVAIENKDGAPMPDTSKDGVEDKEFFVSPFIKGYDPAWYNAMTMRGGYTQFLEDGIFYRLIECDNVEIFADHGLYLGVCEGSFYDNEAFRYDKDTGEITRNEDYKGMNALFDLPIDESKADPKAAAEYLTDVEDGEDNEADESEKPEGDSVCEAWIEKVTPENIDKYAKRVESSVQTLSLDEDGCVTYEYDIEGRGSGSGTSLISDKLKDGQKRVIDGFDYSDNGLDGLVTHVLTPNEDGTVTYAAYIPKESKK